MKRIFTWRTLGLTILWLSGPLLLFAIIYPVFKRAEENRGPSSCQSNLKQMSLGVFQYLQDYDEHYPLVDVNATGISDSNPYGWADALQPYLKSTQIFQCPSEVTSPVLATSGPFNGQPDPTAKSYTDYWYNTRLNGLEQKKILFLASTLMFGDGSDGTDITNARYNLNRLPEAWPPSQRHLDGANYAYADGHVRWYKAKAVTMKKPDGKNTTFLVQ